MLDELREAQSLRPASLSWGTAQITITNYLKYFYQKSVLIFDSELVKHIYTNS